MLSLSKQIRIQQPFFELAFDGAQADNTFFRRWIYLEQQYLVMLSLSKQIRIQ